MRSTMTNSNKSRGSSYMLALALSLGLMAAGVGARPGAALPSLVARASDSISALLSTSARQQTQTQTQTKIQQPSQVAQLPAKLEPTNGVVGQVPEVGQQVAGSVALSSGSQAQTSSAIQAQISAIQAQAQRQINQLTQLVNSPSSSSMGSASLVGATGNGTRPLASNVLEMLSSVGKAIHQQISGSNPNNIQIMASQGSSDLLANTKKNEYQSIGEPQQSAGSMVGPNGTQTVNYREQSEQLRLEIMRRAGQLQQVVASSMDMLKNNGDLIVRRLLEQMNHRLDQAKSKADKILSEPATNEMAIKALTTINQGLNNLNNIITNIVTRLEMSSKDAAITMGNIQQAAMAQQRNTGSGLIIDPSKIKLNIQQLGQQFSSALHAVQQTRQQQQQQLAAGSQLQAPK